MSIIDLSIFFLYSIDCILPGKIRPLSDTISNLRFNVSRLALSVPIRRPTWIFTCYGQIASESINEQHKGRMKNNKGHRLEQINSIADVIIAHQSSLFDRFTGIECSAYCGHYYYYILRPWVARLQYRRGRDLIKNGSPWGQIHALNPYMRHLRPTKHQTHKKRYKMDETANKNYICKACIEWCASILCAYVVCREKRSEIRHTFAHRLHTIQHDNGCQVNKTEIVTKK